MRKASVVEWMLARVMTRANAASVIGDLEEARGKKGEMWFWRSLFSIWLSCGWRPTGGYLVAAAGGGAFLGYFDSAFFSSMALHDWTAAQRAWGSSISLLSGLTAIVAGYCLIRFGVRDVVSRLALGYTVVGAVASTFWWRNEVVFAAVSIAAAIAIVSLLTRSGRRGFGVVAAVTALQILIWPILLTLSVTAGKHLPHSATAFVALLSFSYLAGAGFVCASCGWLHSQLIKGQEAPAKDASFA